MKTLEEQIRDKDSEAKMYKRLWEKSLERISELEAIVARQEAIIKEQARTIERQAAIIEAQAAQIKKLEARVEELERMLNLNSSNSSKPPSTDAWRKPQSLRKTGVKNSGGQVGHEGSTLNQVANPTDTIHHRCDVCEKCGKPLEGACVKHLIKRQVFDIPEPTVEVTEHIVTVKVCTCGHVNQGKFPEDVTAPVQYGPRVKAAAVYLSNQQLIPEDRLQETFKDWHGLPIAASTLAKINDDFAKKVDLKQEQTLNELKDAAVKNLDETGIRIGKKIQWLHVICNDKLTHYRVAEKRGDLLKGVRGIMVHDHWKPYFTMRDVNHALCNAHHLRELKGLEEIEKESWAFKMSKLLRIANRMPKPDFEKVSKLYDKIIAVGLKFHEAQSKLGPRKKRVGHNLLIRLRDYKVETLRFLTNPAVPFTNNQAEQDIRMVKVKQKISGCFRTARGAEIFSTIRGFISTQRKQGFNIFDSIQLALSG